VETLRADIHEAIAAGDATAVDRLFNAAGSPAEVARLLSSSSSEAVPSPLNLAAALWHLDIAERPLDDSADLPILNMTDEEGLSASSLPALHVAICCGHARWVVRPTGRYSDQAELSREPPPSPGLQTK